MALYINGRPVNPIVTFLVSAVVIAGIICLGILAWAETTPMPLATATTTKPCSV